MKQEYLRDKEEYYIYIMDILGGMHVATLTENVGVKRSKYPLALSFTGWGKWY